MTRPTPPNAGKGRPKGSKNKNTALLKEAIIRAAEAQGMDGEGDEGVIGYCRFLAKEEPRAFAALLGRVLPLQVANSDEGAFKIVITQEDADL